MEAQVSAVREVFEGSTLVTQSGTTLTVTDGEDFDAEGGSLIIGDEVRTYTVSGNDLTISSSLSGTYAEDEPVRIYPLRSERIALLLEPGTEEELHAVVPHTMRDRLSLGTRDGDGEIVRAERVGTGELEVQTVIAQSPAIDASFVSIPHGEFAIGSSAALGTSYTTTGDDVVVVPEQTCLALVTFDVTVQIDATTLVHVSLLVNGVQTGPERRLYNAGATNGQEWAVSGNAQVEMLAGEEYTLEVAGKRGAGSAAILGSKQGGLGYILFADSQ